MTRIILPGATIGVLGSGQLGRMFAIAARRMGYRVHTFSPDDDTPTGQVADWETQAAYNDLEAVQKFAQRVDVVTFEFENIPSEAVATAAQFVPVRPAERCSTPRKIASAKRRSCPRQAFQSYRIAPSARRRN